MTTPDDDDLKPRRRWPTYLAIVLVFLIVYPLSIGPAYVVTARIENKFVFIAMNIVYAPLAIFLQMPSVKDAANSYIDWWCRATNTGSGINIE